MPAETGKPPFSDKVAIIRALLLAQNGWRDCLAPADRDQAGRSLRERPSTRTVPCRSLAWCETESCAARGRGLAALRPRRHHPTSFARFPSRALVDGNEARDRALAPMIETILNGSAGGFVLSGGGMVTRRRAWKSRALRSYS